MYLILVEKPSAAQNFAKALGGMSGNFEGQPYKIHALRGHLLEYVEPHEMVSDDQKDAYKSWEPTHMPWDVTQFSWAKAARKGKNPRTGKVETAQGAVNDTKKAASGVSSIVIATDVDPSGEGQLIGWEVIQAIGWKGDVKRLNFIDESEKKLQEGFRNIIDLPHYNQDGEYLKADTRSRWDFVSMQLTRLSTRAAQSKGYNVTVVRQGRLKSVMTKLVADQLERVKAYKKVPYFEVKYTDDMGNVFARKFEDGDDWRFPDKNQAMSDMAKYGASAVVIDSTTRKESAPGKLLDLGGLSSILSAKGFKPKEVLATYQKMYEAKIVSYPRTEDKVISVEQFNEMLPLVDKIANVVGADVSVLTHRKARPTHVKDGAAHGANRPGVVVPSSLSDLSKYGASAEAIYTTLAKNFLAMFGENYVFDAVKGHIQDHPAFTASVSVPVKLGYKAIFDADAESTDDESEEKVSKGLGSTAKPNVAEGVNKKPAMPTQKWLNTQLGKYDVGTGATRVSTLSDITNGKSALLTESRGKLGLTPTGEVAAVLLDGARIADPAETEKLFQQMKLVGQLKGDPRALLQTATDVVKHDKEVFYRNAEKLKDRLGAPTGDMARAVAKPKAEGVFAPTGETVKFNKEWGGYAFTDADIQALLAGQEIAFTATTQAGNKMAVEGKLGQGEFKGKSFWGFQRKEATDFTAQTAPFPASWSGYTFTKADEQKLRAGEKIQIRAVSKKSGNPFEANVTFELVESVYKGKKSTQWKIQPHFDEPTDPSKYTRKDAPFKAVVSGYALTPDEVNAVRRGEKVMVTPKSKKTGKKYSVNVSLEICEYEGRKFWGLKQHFDKR